MCGGGGGGDPAAESRRQEAERQARVKAATETINNIFSNKIEKSRLIGNPELNKPHGIFKLVSGQIPPQVEEKYWVDGDPANSRENQYLKHKNAVYDVNKIDLDRQASEAERANRFGLARAGLLGGSANIDSVADINRRTNEGLMKVGGIAGQAEADLKTADERTRSNLLSMAQSGIDTGTAAQQALKGLEVNSANAAGQRSAATIGRLFDDMSQAYLMRQIMQPQQAMASRGGGNLNPRKTYGGD